MHRKRLRTLEVGGEMKTAWIDTYGLVRIRETQMYPDEKMVYVITPEELEEHSKYLADMILKARGK